MSTLLKLAFICILCAILSLVIKKQTPEIAFLMSVAVLVGCISVGLHLFIDIKERFVSFFDETTFSFTLFTPLLKCCGVSVITQICCSLCKDAGQAAAAVGLEYTGNLICVICILPLLEALFEMIGGLL